MGNFVIVWQDKRDGSDDIFFQRYNSNGIAKGVNTKVNDNINNTNQRDPSIVLDEWGNFVITWQDGRNNIDDIFFQRYDNLGLKIGGNIRVNDNITSSYCKYPSISTDSIGNFVIVWEDERNENSDIYLQQYNFNGIKSNNNLKINDDAGSKDQRYPKISIDDLGNFIIVWEDYREDSKCDIFLQRLNSDGAPLGENIKVNDDVGSFYQYDPSISVNGNGNFVVAWCDMRSGSRNVYFQRYNNLGVPQGINTRANDLSDIDVWAKVKVSMDEIGNFVIVWPRNGNIYFQRYNHIGVKQGGNIKVTDDQTISLLNPDVAMDQTGNFVIAWEEVKQNNQDIYFQRFNSMGIKQGQKIKVNNNDNNSYINLSISMNKVGDFVIAWQDSRNGNYDIYFQRFNSIGNSQGPNTKVNDDSGNAGQSNPEVAIDEIGNFVIVWSDDRDILTKPDIIGQRYLSNGTPIGDNYRIVSDGPNHSERYPIVATNGEQLVFSWAENRIINSDDLDIYAKIVEWDWEGITSYTENIKDITNEFLLEQNYPNPFNPSTTLSFNLPHPSFVTIKLYDVLGREIENIIEDYYDAGYHFLLYTPNYLLASGVYFYQMRAEDISTGSANTYIYTKKMILIR
ncbi:MAG: hypothetical protein B6D44_11155 [Ignavibacteriales bacterium UTCHB2]|nr:MAG: hypothetical protein B6D44_11155 [Ignavibacteriales bacterium UTCHB2]